MKTIRLATILMAIALLAVPASAGQITDTFWIELQGDNYFFSGGGTGHGWDLSPQGDWWTQWFQSDPLDTDRWQEMLYSTELTTQTIQFGGLVYVALAWSTEDYLDSWFPPAPWEEEHIERYTVIQEDLVAFEPGASWEYDNFGQPFKVWDFNPGWVGVSVRFEDFPGFFVDQVLIEGTLWHQCIWDVRGDFDEDGDVDGQDFLKWQRGESPHPFSASDLAEWETYYGTVAPLSATSAAVPEPSTCALAALCLAMSRRWAFQ